MVARLAARVAPALIVLITSVAQVHAFCPTGNAEVDAATDKATKCLQELAKHMSTIHGPVDEVLTKPANSCDHGLTAAWEKLGMPHERAKIFSVILAGQVLGCRDNPNTDGREITCSPQLTPPPAENCP